MKVIALVIKKRWALQGEKYFLEKHIVAIYEADDNGRLKLTRKVNDEDFPEVFNALRDMTEHIRTINQSFFNQGVKYYVEYVFPEVEQKGISLTSIVKIGDNYHCHPYIASIKPDGEICFTLTHCPDCYQGNTLGHLSLIYILANSIPILECVGNICNLNDAI